VTTTPSTQQPRTDLPTQYQPVEVEGPLYERWVKAGYFEADPESGKPTYSMVIPPPNVTGSLHVGHALDHTIMDALVRRRRMQGYETLWLPGMDHAGIATQNVVERELAREGRSRHDLGREEFVRRVWEWKATYGGKILNQMRRLGDSVDWSRERFTMDAGLSRAVRTIFKRLYDDGLVYRAERIINWCPRCMTALSDIEVEHREVDGELTSIRYGGGIRYGGDIRYGGGAEGGPSIVVATTRPETMLGDTAVAVHPDDERYRHLIGAEVELPLTGRRIPIVADPHVDPGFGTGAVKVTPAHDPNDFEIGARHGLPALSVLDERGVITAPGPFLGLDRFEARPAVVRALQEDGRVVASRRPYPHAVGHCSRCDTVVEPRLSLQWFVKVAPLAAAAGDAVRDGRVTIHPPELARRYFAWVDQMHDWCISRQLWWGHRIPVWYGPAGEVVCLGPDEAAPGGDGWRQDPDVLDTWFSAALWPFSTLGWPDDTPDLRAFYPTSVLVTGYDILFFWVVRMMMFGLYAMDGRQPFHVVALHGLVRDRYGRKMSKSRGNAVDPLEWMDRYGSDAVRFALARGASPGGDQAISEEWTAGARNFCNKLWNAARFALLNGATAAGGPPGPAGGHAGAAGAGLSTVDRWLLSRLHATLRLVDDSFEGYELGKAAEALYHFVWDDLCDWYVELAKTPLAAGGPAAERTRAVLGHVLDMVLRALHPMVPFVTETLWTALTGEESVVVAPWPSPDPAYADPAAEADTAALQRVVTEVRRFRADQGLKPGQRVAARLSGLADGALAGFVPAIRALARLTEPAAGFTPTASLSVGALVVELDTSGAIDVPAERARLAKDLAAAEKEVAGATAKLGNPAFTGRAPADVVARMQARLAAAEAEVARLAAALAALPG
jgi:valyl-tRNA synthetase